MNKSEKLRELIHSKETLIVPDAYDALTAKCIEVAGFGAVQCSGFSMSVSKQLADEKLLSFESNLEITKEIVDATSIPVVADGENGYGREEKLISTINAFIDIGTAGINIEDQNFDGKSSDKIIDMESMSENIRIVKSTIRKSGNPDFILNARTDALLDEDRKKGLKTAIDRVNKYYELGADLLFVCYVKTYEELKVLSEEIVGPVSIAAGQPYNGNEFSIYDCQELGIARVSLPTYVLFNSISSILNDLKLLKQDSKFEVLRKKNKFSSDSLNRIQRHR